MDDSSVAVKDPMSETKLVAQLAVMMAASTAADFDALKAHCEGVWSDLQKVAMMVARLAASKAGQMAYATVDVTAHP